MAETLQDPLFHVMAKPTGAACNLDCDYCFFLKKDRLYPGSGFRMSDEVLESYVRQALQANQRIIAWQGGEPTLMGLDFFRRVVALVARDKRLLRLPLVLPEKSTTWRLAPKNGSDAHPWPGR